MVAKSSKNLRQIYSNYFRPFANQCNYFISHFSRETMEGINNKIKIIKRQGYRFRNFENFRLRLLSAFS
ncbi:MAG: transposase [Planktothrix sp.]